MTTGLYGQAGSLTFSSQSDAANGLKRVAVVWSGYNSGQSVSAMTVNVSLQATGLAYLDRDAMTAQTFGLLNGGITISPAGYAAGGYTFTYSAGGFNTNTYPGPQTLFIINYTGTPNCNTPVDTTLQFSFVSINAIFVGSSSYNINAVSSLQPTMGCQYISGAITSPFGDTYCDNSINGGVNGVDVNAYFKTLATSPVNVIVGSNFQTTGNDGNYLLESLASGVNLKVRPSKLDVTPNDAQTGYDHAGCGITTIDTKWMQGYILGIPASVALFQYPWQIIAGDVNLDGNLSRYDITLANAIMAGTSQGPWTFVPTGTYSTFAAPDGIIFGYSYNEELSYSPLNASQSNQNYYGIKLADVDGSCVQCPGLTNPHPVEDRANRALITIPLTDHTVQAGEEFSLPIRLEAEEAMDILAWQINFNPEKFEYVGIQPTSLPFLNDASFGILSDEPGTINFVWTNLDGHPLDAELRKGIFTLSLRAKSSLASLQEDISIISLHNNASFGPSWTEYEPMIKWSAAALPFSSCSVSPVPFSHTFQVALHTDQEAVAYLRVLSPTGRLMYEQRTFLSPGDQQIQVLNTEAWPAGVYIYELTHAQTHYTGRIIKD